MVPQASVVRQTIMVPLTLSQDSDPPITPPIDTRTLFRPQISSFQSPKLDAIHKCSSTKLKETLN